MTRKQKPEPSDHPSPSPRMLARIAEAKLRNAARAERPALEHKVKDATTLETVITRDDGETLLDVFGTTSKDFLASELNRLSNSQLSAGQLHTAQTEMNGARRYRWDSAGKRNDRNAREPDGCDPLARDGHAWPHSACRNAGADASPWRAGDEVASDVHRTD